MPKTKDSHIVIEPRSKLLDFRLGELWNHRDLLLLFVRRDFVALYKQTILGPLWFFIQPVFSTIIFTIIFAGFAGLSTDKAPHVLFYLAGLTLWNYFADCLTKTSETFIQNQAIFGKVYFPRLIVPLSLIISNLLKMVLQFLLFFAVWCYFLFSQPGSISPNSVTLLLPVLILITAGLSLGFGIIFSSLTTKYRDMRFLLQFGVQLMMYASSVVIPLSQVPEKYQWIMKLNPMVSIVETFRYGFLGSGEFDGLNLLYSFCFMIVLLVTGVIIFNRVERSVMDTV